MHFSVGRIFSAACFALFALACEGGERAAFTPAGHDPFVGDWQPVDPGEYVAQVFENDASTYQVNVLVAFDENEDARVAVLRGPRTGGMAPSELRGADGWTGTLTPDCCGSPKLEIANERLRARSIMIHVVRPNRTLREKPPAGAVVLFGKDDAGASSWKRRDGGILESVPGAGRIVSGAHRVREGTLHLEFRMLGAPSAAAVVLSGRHEIRLSESFARHDLAPGAGVCDGGGKVIRALARAERARLEWQTIDVEFFEKSGATRATVFLNGIKIYGDIELPGRARGDAVDSALVLEEGGSPVQFRNMWIKSGSGDCRVECHGHPARENRAQTSAFPKYSNTWAGRPCHPTQLPFSG